MQKQFFKYLMLAVAMGMMFGSCSDNDDSPVIPPQPTDPIPAVVRNLPGSGVWEMPVDYSDPYNWAALSTTTDKPYDVFYLQPTSWTVAEGETSYVASMDNPEMRTVGFVWTTLSGQAVFSDYCNVYAPYYRQADAGYIAGLSWEDAQTFWAYEASKDAAQASTTTSSTSTRGSRSSWPDTRRGRHWSRHCWPTTSASIPSTTAA